MRQCFWKRELSFKLLGFIFLLFDLEVIRSIYQSNLYVWNVSASALHYLLALLLIEKMVLQSRLLLLARKGWRPFLFPARIVSNSIKTEQSQKEIEFEGFLITQDDVKPLYKYIDTIGNVRNPLFAIQRNQTGMDID